MSIFNLFLLILEKRKINLKLTNVDKIFQNPQNTRMKNVKIQ